MNGSIPLKSGQRIALCPNCPQISSVQSRRCCRSRGGCRCRCRCPSNNGLNVCSSALGTDSLNSCCNRYSMSGISGFGFGRSVLDSIRQIISINLCSSDFGSVTAATLVVSLLLSDSPTANVGYIGSGVGFLVLLIAGSAWLSQTRQWSTTSLIGSPEGCCLSAVVGHSCCVQL